MKDRLQEIRDRLEGCSVVLKKDMIFLLDALEQAQEENKNLLIRNKQIYEKLIFARKIFNHHKDISQLNINKYHESRAREQIYRRALANICNAAAPDRALTMNEGTKIYCCARDALQGVEK